MPNSLKTHCSFLSLATTLIAGTLLVGCQSKTTKPSGGTSPSTATSATDATLEAGKAPDSKPLVEVNLDGQVFTLSGQPTVAKLITTGGESRRPLAVSSKEIYFSGRRPGLERWQVFSGLLAENIERRISYDAGEVEPVALLRQGSDHRLVISSTSRATRETSRLLSEYQNRFANKSSANSNRPAVDLKHELFLEVPAVGKRGTQWVSILGESSPRKQLSFEREGKTGVLLAGDRAFRMTVSSGTAKARSNKPSEPVIRWTTLAVRRPTGVAETELTSAAMFPDGSKIAWSNGTQAWTTDLDGKNPERLGDDSLVVHGDLTFEPSGSWLVFSTPTSTRGLNLMALHRSGRCPRVLTEIPGDEGDPSLSPDGQSLFFTQTQGDVANVARVEFVTSERELTETASSCGI